jgi:UDP-2,3-diacylglucosamine pyrophosphatase LpxH
MAKENYQEAIARGLSAALGRADRLEWDLDEARLVVFSDLHRGQRDHADDFRHCETTYARAMKYYFDEGYRLVVLGDSEELWEGWPGKVVSAYQESLELEAGFSKTNANRYFKVWGNHDDLWQYLSRVTKHLAPIFGSLPIPEGLDVTFTRNGERVGRVFLVHGHQGTPGSDKWGKVSRHFVRWIWRPIQRVLKVSLTTPAEDWEIRGKHDRAMYDWAAARNDLILIAGHTHNPVFVSKPHVATLERLGGKVTGETFEAVSPERSEQREHIREEIEWAKAEAMEGPLEAAAGVRDRPCYFNAGCCSFFNGDCTGVEIADGEIRLVRWSKDQGDPAQRVLEAQDLGGVFAGLSA